MTVKRLVSTEEAERNTYRHANEEAEMLPNGPKKNAARAKADDFKARVNGRRKP
jgi:hypothetical protein